MTTRKLDSARLRSMRLRLAEIETLLADLHRQRAAIRQDIGDEEIRLARETANTREAFMMNVMVRWDQDMTVPEIAAALGRSQRDVERALAAGRQTRGVTVRRGRQVRERRRVRDGH